MQHLLQSLKQRRLEWWLAFLTIVWGLVVLWFPQSLSGVSYVVVRVWADHTLWGTLAAAVGVFHIWALYINGRKRWSPYVRVVASAANALLFGLFWAGLLAPIIYGFGSLTATIPAHFGYVWASCCAFWIAGHDSYFALTGPGGVRYGD